MTGPSGAQPPAVAAPSAPPPGGLRARARARLLAALHPRRASVGAGVAFGRDVRIELGPRATIAIGAGATLADRCRVQVLEGHVEIGAHARLGPGCVLCVRERARVGAASVLADGVAVIDSAAIDDDAERPVREQGRRSAPVDIGDGAAIGPGAVLEAGARVLRGACVPAHAVVSPDAD